MIKPTYYLLLIFSLILISCSNKPNQQQDNSQEIVQSQGPDTLIHDYTFGMTRDEFFDLSWKYNAEGVLINGSGAEIVENIDWLVAPAKRVFYPNFENEKIVQLPIVYSYKGWAPWNEHLSADSLMQHLIPEISKDYNVSFEPLSESSDRTIYIGRVNNTEIEISTKSSFEVQVTFTDLSNI
jgi:hypothetical protein